MSEANTYIQAAEDSPLGGGLPRTKTGHIPVIPTGLAQYFAAFNRANWEAVV